MAILPIAMKSGNQVPASYEHILSGFVVQLLIAVPLEQAVQDTNHVVPVVSHL